MKIACNLFTIKQTNKRTHIGDHITSLTQVTTKDDIIHPYYKVLLQHVGRDKE